MSSQEQALADIKAAERDPGSGYDGSSVKTHFPGTVIGFDWPPELMEVVKDLAAAATSQLLVIVGRFFAVTYQRRLRSMKDIDTTAETLRLVSNAEIATNRLASAIPPATPCKSSDSSHDYVSTVNCPISIYFLCLATLLRFPTATRDRYVHGEKCLAFIEVSSF
jgi:hypothetical protein